MSDSVAHDQIRAFVDRILLLKEEAASIKGDIREVYAEAKGNGFDKTVLGKLVSYVEKRANGANDLAEAEALFDLYLSAYDGASASHTHAREDDPEHDEDGVVTEGVVNPPQSPAPQGGEGGEQASINEPEATMLPQTGEHQPLVANSVAGIPTATEPVTIPPVPTVVTEAGDRDRADSSPAAVPVVARADYTKPNPACSDPDDCGVYASWNMLCGQCQRRRDARQHEAGAVH